MADYTKDEQAEHREMWTSALRSGYYKQTTGALQRRDYGGREAYCCLGVACDISELGEWIGRNYLNRSADLPSEVMDWLGLETRDGRYQADDPPPAPPYNNLAQLNDKGKSFGEIADIIEREPKGLLGPTADPWFTELQS